MKAFQLFVLGALTACVAEGGVGKPWPMPIEISTGDRPLKDMRASTSAPDLGYAGAMLEWSTENSEWFYISNRVESAKLMREAGAWVVRPWGANHKWQSGMAWAKTKDREALKKTLKKKERLVLIDPHAYFSFWKENGIKAILCLENYSVYTDVEKGLRSNKIEDVKNVLCEYVRWIVDNGYKECVAGFELGNEPYFGNNPESYGERWSVIVPEIKRIWPEAKIGMPIAEYRAGDPDIAAVRARATGLEWVQSKGQFSFSRLNQWSGRFIVAMSNQLPNVSHVIYHFYGGDASYGCSASGFDRIRNFAKVFPEIADKRVWITEWRERSDEDVRCHQTFSSSLWKGHYLLACLAHPKIDGISLHNLGTLAGGISVSNGKWHSQRDPMGKEYPDPDYAGVPRMEVGPAGPVFKIYCEAIKSHPIIYKYGKTDRQGANSSAWASANYYGSAAKQRRAIATGVPREKLPRLKGDVEWVATFDADMTSLSMLMVNSLDRKVDMPIVLDGFAFVGRPTVRSVTIKEGHVYSHLIPGERPLWQEREEQQSPVTGTRSEISIGPNTVQSVTMPVIRTKTGN